MKILSRLRCWARQEEGVSAMLVALLVIPLIGVVGLAVDAADLWLAHSRLSYAVDSAALAGGRAYFSATRDNDIKAYFAANFPNGYLGATVGVPTITTNAAQTQLTVAATAQVPTMFMKLFNFNSVPMAASSTIEREGGLLVALALDVTGSMEVPDPSKLTSMEQGANALLDAIFDPSRPQSVYAAVVPFRTSINVGNSHKSWIVSTFDWTKFSKNGTTEPWMGCVEARSIAGDLDISDQVPSSDTYKFTPYFYPDTSGYGPGKNGSVKIGSITYYFDNNWPASLVGNTYGNNYMATGPNLNCPAQAVIPLTNDKTVLKNTINSFTGTTVIRGGTQIVAGLAWGWRVLSDVWQTYWGTSVSPGTRTKVLVLLTDGQNEIVDFPCFTGGYCLSTPYGLPGEPYQNSNSIWGQPNSDYTSYGRLNKMNADGSQPLVEIPGPLGATSLTDVVTKLDARMAAACSAIKAQGIVIYTIGYQVPAAAVPSLQACASDPSKYLSADKTTIVSTFKTIASQLLNLKIVK